jgi:hypothetical protein
MKKTKYLRFHRGSLDFIATNNQNCNKTKGNVLLYHLYPIQQGIEALGNGLGLYPIQQCIKAIGNGLGLNSTGIKGIENGLGLIAR